jgi:hypothetical protein
MLNRPTSSEGTVLCPVATGAPIKCGSNRHIAPEVRRCQVRLWPAINHTPTAVAITAPAYQSWRLRRSATATPGG